MEARFSVGFFSILQEFLNLIRMNVAEYISELDPKTQEIVLALRDAILGAYPQIVESIRYKIPFYKMNGMLFFINPRKNYVELGLCNGAQLVDEFGLFHATDRKLIRHLHIRNAADAFSTTTQSIIQQAILVNELKKKK
jgi:hypothetical protein